MVRTIASIFIAAALMAPGAAQAASATPCGLPAVSDPTGDAGDPPRNVGPNLDITEAFFRTEGPTTTAYIRVADMSRAAQDDPTVLSVTWRMLWSEGSSERYVAAKLQRDGRLEYSFGTGTTEEGQTSGEMFEGAGGYVAINLPAKFAPAGGKLVKPFADTTFNSGVNTSGYGVTYGGSADRAPDESVGRDYTIGGCAPAPPSASGSAKPAAPATSPQSKPASSVPALQITGVGARTKGRRLSLSLRSSRVLRRLVVTLKQGKRTVATGRLARIDGDGTVTLKARGSLKRGRYTVVAKAGRVSTTRKLTLK